MCTLHTFISGTELHIHLPNPQLHLTCARMTRVYGLGTFSEWVPFCEERIQEGEFGLDVLSLGAYAREPWRQDGTEDGCVTIKAIV